MLKWLHRVTAPWSHDSTKHLMFTAGYRDHLDVVQWLHAQGVQWPQRLYDAALLSDTKTANIYWTAPVVEWALAHGCTWGVWQCQDFQVQHYPDGFYKDKAVELFAWAHEHGCPCTCDAVAAAADSA
jgi:hypothetical protein